MNKYTTTVSKPDSYPNYFQLQRQLRSLIDHYLSTEHLYDRLQELPIQFANPQPRPWQSINWHAIERQQIVGIDPDVFLAILVGAIETEAPIRQYTQTSRQYLEALHPQLARFVGGTIAADGSLLEPGLWEKEERQHTPALLKIYAQLTGEKITPTPHEARSYQPSGDPRIALYRHGLHRIATEYGATCLYLWLMAHTTGALQAVLKELTRDEINHMTKFWGFGLWAYPETSPLQLCRTLLQTTKKPSYSRDRSSLIGTLQRMTGVLHWQDWMWTNRATFAYTCTRILQRLWSWSNSLTPEYLEGLFGERF
ncbi:MAG: ferritin-like domain-containing protein [Stenomitos rutilans HA7619-LM2]|nr:ferritin-like domain-containing protein [Stenomitos rutilans HA7619-LM2]